MIIPAIDIMAGKTVRLFRGDYGQVTFYQETPQELVQKYTYEGAEWIHVVDLQGAREPDRRQFELIANLSRSSQVSIQIGGGIRSEADLAGLLNAGADRVVIGSLAINEVELVTSWLKTFGGHRIVLALDVSLDAHGQRWLPTQAWQAAGGYRLEEILDKYLDAGVKHILCTDISRDGTLRGSNTELYADLQKQYPMLKWQASGGIGSRDDITAVARTGVAGVIVGKALLEGIFTLKEAVSCWRAE